MTAILMKDTPMLNLLNPFKTAAGIVSATLTLTLLAWTHSQAFRLGIGVTGNPVTRSAAEMLGLAAPQPSCPHSETKSEWWRSIPGFGN